MDNNQIAINFLLETESIAETAMDRDPCGWCFPKSEEECEGCPNSINLIKEV
jgi:hypothetical protein